MAPKCLLPTVFFGSLSSLGLRVIHRVQKDAVYDTDYRRYQPYRASLYWYFLD